MAGWQPMDIVPDAPCAVQLYFGKLLIWLDQHGIPAELPPYREDCERREFGYWDGDHWCYGGTGHSVFEFHDTPDEHLPTHWIPLQEPPR